MLVDIDGDLSVQLVRQIKDRILLVTMFCVLMAIYVQLYRKTHLYFNHRLVLYIRLSTILQCASVYFNDGVSGWQCSLTAFLYQCSGLSQLFWTCMLTTSLGLYIFKQYNCECNERLMAVLCFICSVSLALLPFTTDDYQVNGLTCRIASSEWGKFWRYRLLLPPITIGTVYIIFTNIIMHCAIWRRCRSHPEQSAAFKKLNDVYLKPLTWLTGISIILHSARLGIKMFALIQEEGNVSHLLHLIVFSGYSVVLSFLFQEFSPLYNNMIKLTESLRLCYGRGARESSSGMSNRSKPIIAHPDTTDSNSRRIQQAADNSTTSSRQSGQTHILTVESPHHNNSNNNSYNQQPADYPTGSSDMEQRNELTRRNNSHQAHAVPPQEYSTSTGGSWQTS